jgi:hypothetical protein
MMMFPREFTATRERTSETTWEQCALSSSVSWNATFCDYQAVAYTTLLTMFSNKTEYLVFQDDAGGDLQCMTYPADGSVVPPNLDLFVSNGTAILRGVNVSSWVWGNQSFYTAEEMPYAWYNGVWTWWTNVKLVSSWGDTFDIPGNCTQNEYQPTKLVDSTPYVGNYASVP